MSLSEAENSGCVFTDAPVSIDSELVNRHSAEKPQPSSQQLHWVGNNKLVSHMCDVQKTIIQVQGKNNEPASGKLYTLATSEGLVERQE